MTNIWWLSFADDKGGGNLGCCIVNANGFLEAVDAAHALGINPGGQVRGMEMPDEDEAKAEVEKLGMNRLISAKELGELGYLTEREREEAN